MADPSNVTNWTQGDTYPVLRLQLGDENNDAITNLPDAELILFKAKQVGGAQTISGTALVIDPPDSDGFNLSYDWQALDTNVPGSYQIEVKVIWDTTPTPDDVESWSSAVGDLPQLVIRPALVP
jgi:hypothetical protein